jgi:hypothetical protein
VVGGDDSGVSGDGEVFDCVGVVWRSGGVEVWVYVFLVVDGGVEFFGCGMLACWWAVILPLTLGALFSLLVFG